MFMKKASSSLPFALSAYIVPDSGEKSQREEGRGFGDSGVRGRNKSPLSLWERGRG
jgi:hypothetical protein